MPEWLAVLQEEPGSRRLRRVVLQAAALVVVPSLVAIAADLVRPAGLPLVSDTDYASEILVPCPENAREAESVAVGALPIDTAGIAFVDARTPGEYLAGHVPGAKSIPHRALNTGDAKFRADLARDLEPLRGIPGDRIVVCGDARTGSGRDFAAVLLENGFAGVRWLEGGCEAWAAAGRPFERPAATAVSVKPNDLPADLSGLVFVDARFSRNWRRGHVPGAISIPYRMLDGPGDERLAPLRGVAGASIIVYGSADRGEGADLARVLAASGWPGVRELEGGFEAWAASGRAVEAADAAGADAGGEGGP